MRPLIKVNCNQLKSGENYLIECNQSEYAHIKYKGIFIKNENTFSKTTSHFTNVICHLNQTRSDLSLHENFWNYYKADALLYFYTTQVLREIIGDPDFTYTM